LGLRGAWQAVVFTAVARAQQRADELGTLSVVPHGPVVPGAGVAEHEVVRAEDVAVGPHAHGVHGVQLQVHEHDTWHKATTRHLVVVDARALQLQG
jgi:hypothetical protein